MRRTRLSNKPPSSDTSQLSSYLTRTASRLGVSTTSPFTPTDRIHVLYNLAGTGVVQDMLRDLERRDAGRANAPSPAAHFYAPSPSPGFGGDIIDGDVTHGDLDAFFQSA